MNVDADRANLAGLTNRDVANSSSTAIRGAALTALRGGDKQIPVAARLRSDEISGLNGVPELYVYSGTGTQKVPLGEIARIDYSFRSEVIRHRKQFRTISVYTAPQDGVLSSEVMSAARPALTSLSASLPPGYKLEIGGEEEKQKDGFANLTTVLLISVAAIFLALAFQFRNAIKPFVVFAAVPFGAAGAVVLRADRRIVDRHIYHAAGGAGLLRDLRARPENRQMGRRSGAGHC